MITRKQALYTLSQHYDLSLLYELEPERTEFLIDLAYECPLFCEPKQASVQALMLYAGRLVGKCATLSQLRAEKYERALHDYLDWLLPETALAEQEATG